MSVATYRKTTDLPTLLAIFPLPGAIVFPRWQLPLNIFEPRYLNMIDDAMSGSRLIGMVQALGGHKEKPTLAHVGCAGRITSYSETPDGRYLISLTGICRFKIADEVTAATPYRQVKPDWQAFNEDLRTAELTALPSRADILAALEGYVRHHGMESDAALIESAPMETLINALCSGCPFSVMEKQALLEAAHLKDRAETLIKLLRMDVSGGDANSMN
jgi:Lon protease-like protein